MQLAEIVDAWQAVRATRSRKQKIALLAEVIRRLPHDELAAGTAMLAGEARQGRVGLGYAAIRQVDVAPATAPSLTVTDVDRALDDLEGCSGAGSVARRRQMLDDLFAQATAAEQDYLRGLILANLRQGALEGIVVEAVAAATGIDGERIRRAAMLSGDLTEVAVAATTGGDPAIAAFRLRLLRPVQPMLAQSAATVADALSATGPALVETKLDGMRIQAHRDGDDVRVFTRNLRDVTGGMPAVVAAVRALPADRVVLDGEAMALDRDGRAVAFQESMQTDAALRPWFFDVLHVDGRDLLDEPLAARLEVLDGLAPDALRVNRVVTGDPDVGHALFADAVRAGFEGVVVKAVDAPYESGRRGASWIKVKPNYTLDLVVLAVEWGSGRRQGMLSNLHLGAYDPDGDGFVMLGKTFKGLTDELLAWQTEQLLARQVRREDHVVHVRPELVVEIAFDGVQTSRRYPGGVALRFARVKRYRPDKDPTDADTIGTVRAIHRGDLPPPVAT